MDSCQQCSGEKWRWETAHQNKRESLGPTCTGRRTARVCWTRTVTKISGWSDAELPGTSNCTKTWHENTQSTDHWRSYPNKSTRKLTFRRNVRVGRREWENKRERERERGWGEGVHTGIGARETDRQNRQQGHNKYIPAAPGHGSSWSDWWKAAQSAQSLIWDPDEGKTGKTKTSLHNLHHRSAVQS